MPQWLLELGGALKDEGTIALLIVVATTAGTLIRTFLGALRQAQNAEASKPTLPNPAAAAQVAFAGDRMTVDAMVLLMGEVKEALQKVLVLLERESLEREVDERVQERVDREVMRRLQQEVQNSGADYRFKKPPGE